MINTSQPDMLHIEACNFIDKPTGGQLTFSRQLIKIFGNRLALVGWASANSEPIGRWFEKMIDGIKYQYFAIGPEKSSKIKPQIPLRLTTWLQMKRHLPMILSIGIPNIIIREHAILMAMVSNHEYNICFYFPGVDSPLSISRYAWAKPFGRLFDKLFFQSLSQKTKCVLAAADKPAIDELKSRAGEKLRDMDIVSFPTRVDTDIFHPADHLTIRKTLGLPTDCIIAVTTGRIHWAKGWQFLLDSFRTFVLGFPGSLLIFIGDGAEKQALTQYAESLGLEENIILVGYQPPNVVAAYLQACDLFVMGSLKEGWSTALVEALACHLPIVTTSFSSADTIVKQGINGFIVERNKEIFSNSMERALTLSEVSEYSRISIDRYSQKTLKSDLLSVWPIF